MLSKKNVLFGLQMNARYSIEIPKPCYTILIINKIYIYLARCNNVGEMGVRGGRTSTSHTHFAAYFARRKKVTA